MTNMTSLLKPSINWLLVFVPVAVVLRIWPQFRNETALFICSCLAVVPLAGWMGRATEELAEHLGHGIGGLLNATFGKLSLAIAVVLLVTYACLLGFELVTHKQLYVGDPQDDGEDREEAHRWSVSKSIFVLVVATALVALMSEFL